MKVGDRVRDKISGEVMFVEAMHDEIATCYWHEDGVRKVSDFPIERLDVVGPPPQTTAGMDYNPFEVK